MSLQVYEPEGIYLGPPTEPLGTLVQQWGEEADYFSQYTYNGIPLLGYFGLGFQVEQRADILAVDTGKVTEISIDEGGLDKYIKIDHWWGESLYALLGKVDIVSGQTIERGKKIATVGKSLADQNDKKKTCRFHFSIRIHPHNRFDGWGGFSDPLPYIESNAIIHVTDITLEPLSVATEKSTHFYPPLSLIDEKPYMRRP